MKIAFLRTEFWLGLKAGGSITHISGFAKGLLGLGHQLFFISTDEIQDIDTQKSPIYAIPPSKILYMFPEIPEMAYNFKFVYKSIKILKKEKPDLLYHRYSAFNCSGVILSRILNLPIFLEFNGSEVWRGKYWAPKRWLQIVKIFERISLLGANRVFTVSKVLENDLIGRGIDKERIIMNPNAVDVDIFNPQINKESVRYKYHLGNKIVIGFLGTFDIWHGINVLTDSIEPLIKKNKNIHFLLIGEGDFKKDCINTIKSRHLENFVTFTGMIPHEKVPEYLVACDILISPHLPLCDGSEFFGSPTKLFEYMAMGKPIVASNVGQIGEVLKNNQNGILIKPGSVEELVNGILDLVANEELRRRIGGQARKDAVNNYTWQANAGRVINVYKEMKSKSENSFSKLKDSI
ncbi:glycosyltransferase family 4 protein [bacterium]|nr:glycosyltransferase family 4 protein [bacterium]